jgi:hypothetical protein
MLYLKLIKIVLVHVTSKIIFCYHLPTRGRVGVKLGDALYVANISIIFDAPCLFYTNCFVFRLHFMSFYAFSGTNLLTRCHSANSCFLLFFCFRKVTQAIFSELDKMKPKVPIFPDMRRSPKQRQRRARRWPHHLVARVHPWPRDHVVWGPWVPSNIAPSPIKRLRRENPKSIGVHPRKVPQCRHHRRPILGDTSLCSGNLPRWGIVPGAVSINSTAIFIAVAISHDEEGVVLPRG